MLKPQDLPGRFMREGQQIGYVLPAGSRIVRATIRQDDIDLVRTRLRGVAVKLAERPDETLPARIIREVPAGRDDLPSKALGGTGGGALPVDPRDPQGTKTLQRVFQVDLELPARAAAAAAFGSRALRALRPRLGAGRPADLAAHAAAAAVAAAALKSISMLVVAPPTPDPIDARCVGGRCALSGAGRPQGEPARWRPARRLGPRLSLSAVGASRVTASSALRCGVEAWNTQLANLPDRQPARACR